MNLQRSNLRRRALTRLTASFAIAIAATLGCGGESGTPQRPISGMVKLDGQPLGEGSITFLPTEKGGAANAVLSAGVYRIRGSEGLEPGRYTVEIIAVKPTGKRVRHPDLPSETIEEVRNVIPQRYNTRSQLLVDVALDQENKFDFDLSSREDPKSRLRR